MHRQSWIALAWCFVLAMGILVCFGRPETEVTRTVTTTTTVTRGSVLASPSPSPLPAPEPPPVIDVATTAYIGNIKTKKFHRLSCRYAGCTNCKAKFATRAEAIEAGFDPCGICNP